MENAIAAVLSVFPFQLVKIITCDRGTEFANWLQIEEQLHCEVYFAGPYCVWQKGAIENLNGLFREFYPKGRTLSRGAPATLKRNLALLNARPRKVLNFHSAQELWDLQLNSCCTWFDNSLKMRVPVYFSLLSCARHIHAPAAEGPGRRRDARRAV